MNTKNSTRREGLCTNIFSDKNNPSAKSLYCRKSNQNEKEKDRKAISKWEKDIFHYYVYVSAA